MASSVVFSVFLFACFLACVSGHGLLTYPRCRGALITGRNINPQVLSENAPRDYCAHCLNANGVYHTRGGYGSVWSPYKPMESRRGGFGLCGDNKNSNDHMKIGKYANPPDMPFTANFAPGSVANFEFDATANHGGYLEFYLCDVAKMPYQDISYDGFEQHCHHLERVPNASCESGNDRDCGPIDPDGPTKWVLPCGSAGGDTGDQMMGGKNGKMAYRIPNVEIKMGVIQMYWLTTNSCTTEFMNNYNYPNAWAGCWGDGGSIGGKPMHTATCDMPGQFPEEVSAAKRC